MDLRLILTICTIIFSFFLSFSGFLIYLKNPQPKEQALFYKNLAFAPYCLSCILLFSILYFITPTATDFVRSIDAYSIIIPLLCAIIVYSCTLFQQTAKYTPLTILAAIVISTLLLPSDFLLFNNHLPFWLDRICIIATWFLFANFYYILNGVEGLLGAHTLSIGISFLILCFIDAIPLFYGLVALSIIGISGSFLIFNWFPARISFTTDSCKVLGFIIGWLLIYSSSENMAPCNFILIAFYILELIQASIKKISLRDKFATLTVNTTYYQANISGLSPTECCVFLFKLQTLLIIIACFQLYSPNTYSLPMLSLLLTAWFLTKLKDWQNPNTGIHEVNKNFIQNIRQNIDDIKNKLGKN